MYIRGKELNEVEYLKKLEKDYGFISYLFKNILEYCRISPLMFDKKYDNKDGGWGIGQKRGPPNHLVDYDPPIGYLGYGLSVENKYDNGDNTWLGKDNKEGEWYIAYHGTDFKYVKDILEKGFGRGDGQYYSDDENINKLSNPPFEKCGKGVYCTPKIKEAETYAKPIRIGNFNYIVVIMVRVNPYKIRIPVRKPDYWIVSGDDLKIGNIRKYDDEIRPYRILIKRI